MTETVSGAAKGATAGGMKIERVFSTEGVHPYDELTWERRDVVQTNWKTGVTVFEQRGVEFPDFWSVNASTIVTTKYFRGALGSEKRETGLKQLIDRVVLTYVKAGKDHGYFSSAEDAEIFEHELTYALLHQVFSFNSPVWFNVGIEPKPQCSACFINSVQDTMSSIMDLAKTEAMLFKFGSGAGSNLSWQTGSGDVRPNDSADDPPPTGGDIIKSYYLLKETQVGTDPFAAESLLIFGCGVAGGNLGTGLARFGVVARSPLSGGIFESRGEGPFARGLKGAG